MYFINKQYGAPFAEHAAGFGATLLYYFAYFFDSAAYSREGKESDLGGIGDYAGQCGLAHARRTPQDKGIYASRLNHAAQYGTGPYEVGLAYVVIKSLRSEPFGQWLDFVQIYIENSPGGEPVAAVIVREYNRLLSQVFLDFGVLAVEFGHFGSLIHVLEFAVVLVEGVVALAIHVQCVGLLEVGRVGVE